MYIQILLTYLCSLKADVLCSQKKKQPRNLPEEKSRHGWLKHGRYFTPPCVVFQASSSQMADGK